MRRLDIELPSEVFGFSKRSDQSKGDDHDPILRHKSDGMQNIDSSIRPISRESTEPYPPVVMDINLEDEYFVIFNPNPLVNLDDASAQASGHMAGCYHLNDWTLADQRKNHIHRFDRDAWILPGMKLHVYTCPGKNVPATGFREPYVLLTNRDGSLRKKEILNNDADSVYLFDNTGECRSYCSATRVWAANTSGDSNMCTVQESHIIHQGIVELFGTKSITPDAKPSVQANNSTILRAAVLLSVLRLGLVIVGLSLAQEETLRSMAIVWIYWCCFFIDILTRYVIMCQVSQRPL